MERKYLMIIIIVFSVLSMSFSIFREPFLANFKSIPAPADFDSFLTGTNYDVTILGQNSATITNKGSKEGFKNSIFESQPSDEVTDDKIASKRPLFL